MTARAPVYIDSGKLHVFEDGDTLPPWLSPSSMAWENLTGVPAGITQLADLTGPGYAKIDAAGAWSVQAAIPQADVSGLATALAGLQPISARLTAIAGLTDTAGWLHDDGLGNWALTTPTKSDVGLSLVENTALSTWGGSANLATLGTVTTGVWHGTAIADAYISSAAAWNAKEGFLGNPSASGYLLSSTSAGVRSWVAPYSLPTATASVLGGVKVGTGLAIASGVLSVAYGTAAGTACVGNDSRLSDSRTPTAHALDGALHTISGKTAGQVLVATGATTFGFATISGDAALSGAGALTLATLLTAGSAGSATTVPTLTWDAKGRLTAVGSAAISISHTQINDWSTATSSFLTANQSISLTGAVTGSGTTSIATSFANTHLAGIDQDLTTTSSPTFTDVNVNGNVLANSGIYSRGDLLSLNSAANGWNTVIRRNSGSPIITALGGFVGNLTGNLNGTASNASALGGVSADYFVQGQNATRTVIQPTAATSQSQLFKSGFYCSQVWTDAPVASTWTHLIHTQYGNDGGSSNNWSFDIAANFGSAANPGSPEGYYVRAIAAGSSTGWRQLIHSANYTSFNNFTSGLTTTTLTASGLITANGGISGNLTGHASLDIPLTGSSAITGSLISSNASNLGLASLPWGSVYGTTLYENGTALASKYLSTTYSGSLSLYGLTLNNGGLSVQGVSSFTNKVTITDDLTANRIKSWTITPRSTDSYALGGTTLYWYGTYTNRLFCAIGLNAPSTATDVGIAGQIVFDSSYIYVCTATNTWRRAALATW